MSKSKEELEELKKEVEDFNKKVQKLTEEELAQVTGGFEFGDHKHGGAVYIDGHDHIGVFSSGPAE